MPSILNKPRATLGKYLGRILQSDGLPPDSIRKWVVRQYHVRKLDQLEISLSTFRSALG